MPVQGIWGSSVQELHFTWRNCCAWYSVFCICITLLDTFFAINMAAGSQLDVRSVGEIPAETYAALPSQISLFNLSSQSQLYSM